MQGTLPPPYSSSVPGGANGSPSSPVSTMTSQSSTSSSLAKQRQSWLDLVSQAAPVAPAASPTCAEVAVVCSAQVHSRQALQGVADEVDGERVPEGPSGCATREAESNEGDFSSEEDEDHAAGCEAEEEEGETFSDVMRRFLVPRRTSRVHLMTLFFFFSLTTAATNSDEMQKLYIHLKEASLSPTGQRKPSTKREFRASFIKRCKNQSVNDKLHLIRTLNSTLKVHTLVCTPLGSSLKKKRKVHFSFT